MQLIRTIPVSIQIDGDDQDIEVDIQIDITNYASDGTEVVTRGCFCEALPEPSKEQRFQIQKQANEWVANNFLDLIEEIRLSEGEMEWEAMTDR